LMINEPTLWATHCSGRKNPIREGEPEQLYDSTRISALISCCKRRGLAWGIVSAKYGLFFPDEKRPNYNTTFRSDPATKQCMVLENNVLLDETASRAWMDGLALRVKKAVLARNIKSIVFWPGEPRNGVDPLMRVKCYLSFLHVGIDECNLSHNSWREIVHHINALTKSGGGRIVLIDKLPE